MRYGFVGLGHLGGHLAASLIRAGFPVTVSDLDRSRAEPLLAAGAMWADDPAALASAVEAAITCLPSPKATAAVLAELLPAMRDALIEVRAGKEPDFVDDVKATYRYDGFGVYGPLPGGVR